MKKMGRGSKQTFFQRRHPNGQWAYEKMLSIINYHETQIKTTAKYYPTPLIMAMIKRTRNKCWQRCGEKGTPVHCW